MSLYSLLLHCALALISFFSVRLSLPKVLGMLSKSGLTRPNFRGENIPTAAGMVFLTMSFIWIAAGVLLRLYFPWQALSLLMLLMAFGFAGMIDDYLGNRAYSGLRGHWRALRSGELSTGAFKAIFGGAAALVFAIFVARFTDDGKITILLMNTFIVALSANAVNLFDLRPGRAGKVFIFGTVALFLVAFSPERITLMFPILAALLGYLPADLSAKAMMGDTGSNALGAALGAFAVFTLSPLAKIIYLVLLVGLHVVAELTSLSKIIENSVFLKAIDRWGRKE